MSDLQQHVRTGKLSVHAIIREYLGCQGLDVSVRYGTAKTVHESVELRLWKQPEQQARVLAANNVIDNNDPNCVPKMIVIHPTWRRILGDASVQSAYALLSATSCMLVTQYDAEPEGAQWQPVSQAKNTRGHRVKLLQWMVPLGAQNAACPIMHGEQEIEKARREDGEVVDSKMQSLPSCARFGKAVRSRCQLSHADGDPLANPGPCGKTDLPGRQETACTIWPRSGARVEQHHLR